MSLKNIFKKTQNPIINKTYDEIGDEVESSDYIDDYITRTTRFIPQVDFDTASNFCKFGSAEKYYKDAAAHIYNDYPYDGSGKEKHQWHNSSSFLENYFLLNKYPRSTGYANMSANGWGAATTMVSGYGQPVATEYIRIKGGPNIGPSGTYLGANFLDTASNRGSNLEYNLNNGVTFEFWLKKIAFNTVLTEKEVIFDLWNSASYTTNAFGRFRIELTGTAGGSPFRVTALSGTTEGVFRATLGSNLTIASLTDWNHFAVSAINSGSDIEWKLYVNGDLNHRILSGTDIGAVTGALVANIGALTSEVSGGIGSLGWGKLSASLDDVRYWKIARSHQQIGRNWFSNINGGTNTDTANTTLGVYYKFNEGITTNSIYDINVLDYSGRISNGYWYGYDSFSRSTGSAMVESGAIVEEPPDPILYRLHPDVNSLIETYVAVGREFDTTNNSYVYNMFPNWILDEDNDGHIKNLAQIIGNYFDKLYLQIESLSKLKDIKYPKKYDKPIPFNKQLLESVGMYFPEIFVDSEIIEALTSRDEDRLFKDDLFDIKNLIYQNIYNNIAEIYKTKGSERSLRNVLRCFGVDTELIKMNMYANNATYTFEPNFISTAIENRYVDFNNVDRANGSIWQTSNTSYDANNVRSFLSSSDDLSHFPLTSEVEIILPKQLDMDVANYFAPTFVSSSIFGFHDASGTNANDYTWQTPDSSSMHVFVARNNINSDSARFVLSSSFGQTSSVVFEDTYNNSKWNLALRVKPGNFPFSDRVSGSIIEAGYKIELYGVNPTLNIVDNEFLLTQSITYDQGRSIMRVPKRLYVGAHRTNFTGSLINRSNIRVLNSRVWLNYLDDDTIKYHSFNGLNYGVSGAMHNAYPFLTASHLVKNLDTLALNWDFSDITSSTSNFIVQDFSSGSLDSLYGNYIDGVINTVHLGSASFFDATSDVVGKEYTTIAKQQVPEIIFSDDMVNILEQDTQEAYTRDNKPLSYFLSIEKNMYQNISEEMLNMFTAVVEFNELIGAPINRYRQDYKLLEKAKERYFANVQNTPDIEKFVDFYKWLDSSLSQLLFSLLPASIDSSEKIRTVVESHILERNKYWNKFPTFKFKRDGYLEAGIRSINELLFDWKYGHSPVQTLNPLRGKSFDTNNSIRKIVNLSTGSATPIDLDFDLTSGTGHDFTFWFWLKHSEAQPGGLNPAVIFAKSEFIPGILAGAIRIGNEILYDKVGDNLLLRQYGTLKSTAVNVPLTPNQWENISFVWENTDITLYKDAASQGTMTRVNNANSASCADFSASLFSLYYGNDPANDMRIAECWNGKIAEAAVWSSPLDQASLQLLYDGDTPPSDISSSALVSWWRFGDLDGDSTSTLNDFTTNNNGTPYAFSASNITNDYPPIAYYSASLYSNIENINCFWQRVLKEKTDGRAGIHQNQFNNFGRSLSKPYYFDGNIIDIKPNNKNPEVVINTIRTRDLIFGGFNQMPSCSDLVFPPDPKRQYEFSFGELTENNLPFTFHSASLTNAYTTEFTEFNGKAIGGLHKDVSSNALQGPFTEKYVGGYQHRHVAIGDGTDTILTRPEGWRLVEENNQISLKSGAALSQSSVGGHSYSGSAAEATSINFGVGAGDDNFEFKLDSGSGDAFTIMFWAKSTNITGTLFGKFLPDAVVANQRGWAIAGNNNRYAFLHHGHCKYFRESGTDENVWVNGTLSTDTNHYNLYLDGVLSCTASRTGSAGLSASYDDVSASSFSLFLGSQPSTDYQDHFNGHIAEAVIWKTNLSAATIDQLHSGNLCPIDVSGASLISHWRYGDHILDTTDWLRDANGVHTGECFNFISASITKQYPQVSYCGSAFTSSRSDPHLIWTRDEYTKRPINVRNILNTTGSTIIGNFNSNYEIVQTCGRQINDFWYRDGTPITGSSIALRVNSSDATRFNDFTLPTRTTSKSVIVNRFSSPGDMRTLTRGFLVQPHEELSAYNALPYRNLSLYRNSGTADLQSAAFPRVIPSALTHTRADGLRTLLSRRMGKFGLDAEFGTLRSEDYDSVPSFHNVHSNPLVYHASNVKYDNWYQQHEIPRTPMGYTWISSSFLGSNVIGHPFSAIISSSQGFINAIDFMTASSIVKNAQSGNFVTLKYNTGYDIVTSSHFLMTSSLRYRNPDFMASEDPDSLSLWLSNINGPYGFSSWQQANPFYNPLLRFMRNNNMIGFTNAGTQTTFVVKGARNIVQPMRGTVDYYREPAVVSHTSPIEIGLQDRTDADVAVLKFSYGNDLEYFSNQALNTKLGLMKDKHPNLLRLEATYQKPDSKFSFQYMKYGQDVWPNVKNTNLIHAFIRQDWSVSQWKSERKNRSKVSLTGKNSMGDFYFSASGLANDKNYYLESIWPLDGRMNFESGSLYTASIPSNPTGAAHTIPGENILNLPGRRGQGELQNDYTIFHNQYGTNPSFALSNGCLYNYPTIEPMVNPPNSVAYVHDVMWETPIQAGKEPFFTNYNDWLNSTKFLAHGFSIIPEFRISEWMHFYHVENQGNFLTPNESMFSVTGANFSSSVSQKFQDLYVDSNKMRNMDQLDKSLEIKEIELDCDAVMKFLPYEEFYPAQRTLKLASLFSASYLETVSRTTIAGGIEQSGAYKQIARPILQPYFQPGILYNTIKSGIACDYPVLNTILEPIIVPDERLNLTQFAIGGATGTTNFNRIKFENILSPVTSTYFYDQNVHPSASLKLTCSINLNTQDRRYYLAMHNFLANSLDWNLKDGKLTTIISDYKVRNDLIDYRKTYGMSVTLERGDFVGVDELGTSAVWRKYKDATGVDYGIPRKNYTNPFAFGPTVSDNSYGGISCAPYTPPYYAAQGIVNCKFTPIQGKKYTIEDIVSELTSSYDRFVYCMSDATYGYQSRMRISPGGGVTDSVAYLNAMQLSSSVNLFELVDLKPTEYEALTGKPLTVKDKQIDQLKVWAIQPKFESPILEYQAPIAPTSGNLDQFYASTMPTTLKAGGVRGMWHGYGTYPNSSDNKVFLKFYKDILWPKTSGMLIASASLLDIVGFPEASYEISKPRDSKQISEAMVAIPFIYKDNKRVFYTLPTKIIEEAKIVSNGGNNVSKVDPAIVDMVTKMKKFVIPPRFNFLDYPEEITPIAMFLFDFNHTLSQKDLLDWWQNLPPKLSYGHKTQNRKLKIQIGKGKIMSRFSSDTQWMVFKVKQKGEWNYYKKTISSRDDERFQFELNMGRDESNKFGTPKYSYNWPYDYFSLVEFGKVHCTLNYGQKPTPQDVADAVQRVLVSKTDMNVAKVESEVKQILKSNITQAQVKSSKISLVAKQPEPELKVTKFAPTDVKEPTVQQLPKDTTIKEIQELPKSPALTTLKQAQSIGLIEEQTVQQLPKDTNLKPVSQTQDIQIVSQTLAEKFEEEVLTIEKPGIIQRSAPPQEQTADLVIKPRQDSADIFLTHAPTQEPELNFRNDLSVEVATFEEQTFDKQLIEEFTPVPPPDPAVKSLEPALSKLVTRDLSVLTKPSSQESISLEDVEPTLTRVKPAEEPTLTVRRKK